MKTPLTPEAERAMEREFANTKEAWVLLDLINAEFQSDPTSTQCFDRRIVERVRACVASHKEFREKHGPLP